MLVDSLLNSINKATGKVDIVIATGDFSAHN